MTRDLNGIVDTNIYPDNGPRVVFTVFKRYGDLHVALLSLRSYPKISVVVMDSCPVPKMLKVKFPSVEWLRSPVENHLSSGWNLAFTKYDNEEALLVCNEDVLFPVDWYSRLELSRQKYPDARWLGLTQSVQFSGFLMHTTTFRVVGNFDENFRTYFEDDDYWLRLEECYGQSKRVVVVSKSLQAVVIHRRTGWSWDERARRQMMSNFAFSEKIFISKWNEIDAISAEACKSPLCCLRTRRNVAVRSFENPACVNISQCYTRKIKLNK
jgi:hypothetical protein